MWNFRFKTQKDNLFGGQTVVENTLRQEGNQLVNEGSQNMKQTNLEVYQNRDEKKFISKNNRQSGRKLKNKEKTVRRVRQFVTRIQNKENILCWPKLEIKLNY